MGIKNNTKGNSLLLLLILWASFLQAQPLDIPLQKGIYAAGFTSFWKYDLTRLYDLTRITKDSSLNKRSARPIFIGIWYPAVKGLPGTTIQYGKYLEAAGANSVPASFLEGYKKYNREVSVSELTGKKEDKLTKEESVILKKIFATSTNAFFKAKQVEGKFPVVIYHPGNGASLDDNVLLCELLASHGYIVVTSSFFNEEAATWGVDARLGSVRDISFILAGLPSWIKYADMTNMAMVGHSAGAQASHITMAQGVFPIKTMVSIETTQEYYSLYDKRWRGFLNPTLDGIDKVKGNLLFVAKPHGIFQLADSMKNANRYYYTIPNVAHNDFISQGIVSRYTKNLLSPSRQREAEFQRTAADYNNICIAILSFLDVQLKQKTTTLFTKLDYANVCNRSDRSCIEFIPAGYNSAPVYQNETYAPGARQFYQLAVKNIEQAIAVLNKFSADSNALTIYDFTFAHALMDGFLEMGKNKEAAALYKAYLVLFGKQFSDDIRGKCEFFAMFNKQLADTCFKKLALLTGE